MRSGKKKQCNITAVTRSTTSEDNVADVTLTDAEGNAVTAVESGTSVTATAPVVSGYAFVGWFANTYTEGAEALSGNLAYTFEASEDLTLVAVYEASETVEVSVTGNGFDIIRNGSVEGYNLKGYSGWMSIGTTVTVISNTDNFLYWTNASNKIVSTEPEYTFIVTGETTLQQVYNDAASGSTAFVAFLSESGQVLSGGTYSSADTIVFPTIPSKIGYETVGWSMTEEEIQAAIAAGETYISVTPVYEETGATSTLTVFVDGSKDESLSQEVTTGSTLTVTAPETEGKVFAYWTTEDGTILSYSQSYFLMVSSDTAIYAVYEEEATVTAEPTINMTDMTAIADNGENQLAFTATHDVPDGYTVVEHGMVYGTNPDTSEYVTNSTASKVRQMISSNTALKGVFTVYISVGENTDTPVYARGYMIVINNATGNQETIYTDVVSRTFNE